MTNDTRCCGSGACIIDPEGRCWCGQRWDTPTADKALVDAESNAADDCIADVAVQSDKVMPS